MFNCSVFICDDFFNRGFYTDFTTTGLSGESDVGVREKGRIIGRTVEKKKRGEKEKADRDGE